MTESVYLLCRQVFSELLDGPLSSPRLLRRITCKATDADKGTRFTCSIASGNDGGIFEIEKRTGIVKLAKAPTAAS